MKELSEVRSDSVSHARRPKELSEVEMIPSNTDCSFRSEGEWNCAKISFPLHASFSLRIKSESVIGGVSPANEESSTSVRSMQRNPPRPPILSAFVSELRQTHSDAVQLVREKVPCEARTTLNAPPNILPSLTQELMRVLWMLNEVTGVDDEKMAATGELDV